MVRACRSLGIETVVVDSTADRDGLAARMADRAVCIGPAPATQSYLHIPSVLSAALGTGSTVPALSRPSGRQQADGVGLVETMGGGLDGNACVVTILSTQR